ncbi:hypothetical protein NPIL_546061 [Nephila pilipes]|uniref:Uncharacterized protein n=1 Tax=Nephila pilipes TaxID=299642 RepID=A0A8X6N6V2_NEPPI|nr:hypothetical protein NPIL_546061 [Nephila pilipes]
MIKRVKLSFCSHHSSSLGHRGLEYIFGRKEASELIPGVICRDYCAELFIGTLIFVGYSDGLIMTAATGHFSMSFSQAMLLNDEDFMGKPPRRCLGGISSLSAVVLAE